MSLAATFFFDSRLGCSCPSRKVKLESSFVDSLTHANVTNGKKAGHLAEKIKLDLDKPLVREMPKKRTAAANCGFRRKRTN